MAYHWPKDPNKRVQLVGEALTRRSNRYFEGSTKATDIARRYKVSVDLINSLNLVFHAHPDLVKALENKLINQSQAVEIARVKPTDKQVPFLNACLIRKTSIRELRANIKNNNQSAEPLRVDGEYDDPNTNSFVEQLEYFLNSPVKIRGSRNTEMHVHTEIGYLGHIQMLEFFEVLRLTNSKYHVDTLHHGFDRAAQLPYGTIRISFSNKDEFLHWTEIISHAMPSRF